MENKNHKIILNNRAELNISGVEKVNSATEKQIILSVQNSLLNIYGVNLHVNKLNIEQGDVEIVGNIDLIKYNKSSANKDNFLKRIFK